MPGDFYLGREGQFFVSKQTAFGTMKWPVAAEAIRLDSISGSLTPEREPRNTDYRGTRSRGPTVSGRRSAEFSGSGNLYASGSLGVQTDIFEILTAAFGIETITGGVSVAYSLAKDLETVFNGLSIHHFGNFFATSLLDCIINEFTFQIPGDGHITFEFSGVASDLIRTGSSQVLTGQAAGQGTIILPAGHGKRYSAGGHVSVAAVGDHTISSVTVDTLNVTPNVVAAQVAAQLVVPVEPTGVTVGTAIPITKGQVLIDSVATKIISGNVKIAAPNELRNKHYGSAVASGFHSGGKRDVTVEFTIDHSKPNFGLYGDAIELTQKDIQIDLGNVAGNIFQIDLNKVEFEVPEMSNPDEGEAEITYTGSALPTANEDEISVIQK